MGMGNTWGLRLAEFNIAGEFEDARVFPRSGVVDVWPCRNKLRVMVGICD